MKRRKRRKRRNLLAVKIAICIVFCAGILAALKLASETVAKNETVISLKVVSADMREGQEVPKTKVDVESVGNPEEVLDEKTGYKVRDLINDLRNGKEYKISNQADGKREGEFPLEITLSEQLKSRLEKEWSGKVVVHTTNGRLKVRNRYGDWEGKKFKKVDGTFAVNEFVTMGEDKYYFGETGEMTTGILEQGAKRYVFSDDGKLQKEEVIGLDPKKPMIALTFDDGPGPETDRILDALQKVNGRATFFMLGPAAKRYAGTVKRIADLNCELGNHSTNHKRLDRMDAAGIRSEMDTTNKAVADATGGQAPTVMRPPYGAINATVKETVGLPVILWSVDTLDWKTRNTQSTIDCVLNKAKDGDIVLMHDIHKASVDAAVELIPKLVEKGYQLVTVSELAQIRGVSLENGGKYFSFPG